MAIARPVHDGVAAAIFLDPTMPPDIRSQLALAQTGWKEPDVQAALRVVTEAALTYRDSPAIRSHDEASESAARAALDSADILHFAGPVQVSGVTPLLSLVALAGTGETADRDGRWEVREWFSGNSHARVMVLSDGGSFGAPGAAAAMDAFAWAAAAAGIPTLLVGRWPSDGFATEDLLTAFHRGAATGRTPADAWTTATATIRTKNGNTPSAWTGLRLIGSGR
jgi:CHAT domain-containing protein